MISVELIDFKYQERDFIRHLLPPFFSVQLSCNVNFSEKTSPALFVVSIISLEKTKSHLRAIRRNDRYSSVPIIVAGEGISIQDIIELIHHGACQYISFSDNPEKISNLILSQLSMRSEKQENGFCGIMGTHPRIKKLCKQIELYAKEKDPVLIMGETGTGKSLVAKALHTLSPEKEKSSFIPINCANLEPTLFESLLFGSVQGAFTGATNRKGYLSAIKQGIVFLDEFGELPYACQAKVLHVIENRKFYPVGSVEEKETNARFVLATNKPLHAEVNAGKFRKDLFFRISRITLTTVPLRDIKNDFPSIIPTLLAKECEKRNKPKKQITEQAIKQLQQYAWPGNYRELESVLIRCIIETPDSVIREIDIPSFQGMTLIP